MIRNGKFWSRCLVGLWFITGTICVFSHINYFVKVQTYELIIDVVKFHTFSKLICLIKQECFKIPKLTLDKTKPYVREVPYPKHMCKDVFF